MADVSEKKENMVKGRGRPPKNKEKLWRKKPMDCLVVKKQETVERKSGKHESQAKKKVKFDDDTVKPNSLKRKRELNDDFYDYSPMERAKEIQANLPPEFPSFIKYMRPSHVTGGFWLGLPAEFCLSHLPKEDTMIVLEDDNGVEYETKYLSEKGGLSAKWRGYSIEHKLVEGDVLVFHLVKPFKFKVYTVRANSSDEVDGALGLLKLEAYVKQMDSDEIVKFHEEPDSKCLEPLMQAITQENDQKNSLLISSSNSGDESEDLVSEVLDGIRFSESVIDFQEVKDINDFNILVNGLIINSEVPKHILTKYYELCRSQQSYLHHHLLEGLNCKLAVGIIIETTNIADGIRASNFKTSQADLTTWDETLKAFQVMGMNVGFLRARLDQLMSLTDKSDRCNKARLERAQAEEELRNLEAKVLEVKELIAKLDVEIESPDWNANKLEIAFKEVAHTPWG